jgi:hypothetical protein
MLIRIPLHGIVNFRISTRTYVSRQYMSIALRHMMKKILEYFRPGATAGNASPGAAQRKPSGCAPGSASGRWAGQHKAMAWLEQRLGGREAKPPGWHLGWAKRQPRDRVRGEPLFPPLLKERPDDVLLLHPGRAIDPLSCLPRLDGRLLRHAHYSLAPVPSLPSSPGADRV